MLHISDCLRFMKIPANTSYLKFSNRRLCALAVSHTTHNSKSACDWNVCSFSLARLYLNHKGFVADVPLQKQVRFAVTKSSNKKASLVQSEQNSADLTLAEKGMLSLLLCTHSF